MTSSRPLALTSTRRTSAPAGGSLLRGAAGATPPDLVPRCRVTRAFSRVTRSPGAALISASEKKRRWRSLDRQADVYAAHLAYTDHEIGRVIQAVEL
jgi:hypothetical protein